jgi:phage shock protein C
MSKKKLYKSRKNKMIGGVCGGLAEYLNMDPTIVRIIAGVLCLVKGLGVLVYLIMCIVMPYDDEDFSEDDMENLKSANINPEDEKKSSKKESSEKESKFHSDEEFDSYFKNDEK